MIHFSVRNSTIVADDGRVVALFGLAVIGEAEAQNWARCCCAAMNEDCAHQAKQQPAPKPALVSVPAKPKAHGRAA